MRPSQLQCTQAIELTDVEPQILSHCINHTSIRLYAGKAETREYTSKDDLQTKVIAHPNTGHNIAVIN